MNKTYNSLIFIAMLYMFYINPFVNIRPYINASCEILYIKPFIYGQLLLIHKLLDFVMSFLFNRSINISFE